MADGETLRVWKMVPGRRMPPMRHVCRRAVLEWMEFMKTVFGTLPSVN